MTLNKISFDDNYIAQRLSQKNKFWKMNPSLAPHFGDIWGKINRKNNENTSHNVRKSATAGKNFPNNCDRKGGHPKPPPHNLCLF